MNITDFITVIKRECRYGTPAVITDQPTADILAEINIRRKRAWAKWDWAWSLEAISFPLTAGVTQYSVLTVSGNPVDRITDLYPSATNLTPAIPGRPIQEITRQQFYTRLADYPPALTIDQPRRYINVGRNANGQWQVIFDAVPNTAMQILGWGKAILKTFVQADVVANTAFDYFPDGVVEDTLLDGVKSGIYAIQGNDAESSRLDQSFEMKLKMLVQEQDNAATDNSGITSPMPQAWIRMRARRYIYGSPDNMPT